MTALIQQFITTYILKAPSEQSSKVILAVVVLAFIIVYAATWFTVLSYPHAIEYEGMIFWAAQRICTGQNIYDAATLSTFPLRVITYPPLFPIAAGILMKLFGVAYWCLRVVSIVSTLVCAFFFFRILRVSGCTPLVSAIGPCYLLAFSPAFYWAQIGRPDMLALAFCLAALERLLIASVRFRDEQAWLLSGLTSGVLFGIALIAKQTSLACVASAFLFLLWNKQYKVALANVASCAAVAAVLSAVTQMVTGGYVQHVSIFAKTPWDSDVLLRYIHFMSDADTWLMEIILAVLLYCLVFKKQNLSYFERLPYALIGVSMAQMLYIMGLPGSNGNHAIIPFLAFSWWLALKASTLPVRIAQFILIVSMSALPSLYLLIPTRLALVPEESALSKIDLKGKLVLAEDPYLNYITGSEPAIVDSAVFTSVWKKNPEKLKMIADSISHRSYAAIIINSQDSDNKGLYFWPDVILDALRKNYTPGDEVNGNGIRHRIWLPKN